MAEQNHLNTNLRDFERAALQQIVIIIRQYRNLLGNNIHGHEMYHALLNFMEDIVERINRVGEHPESEAGRDLIDIYFDEIFETMQVFDGLFD
ncbi:hypothetical protein GCK72_025211 [Caenorhabditis remanei]|uniref:Uncharacterized protein n=1 Tax=Caenorhabditis remanei TaxID=31234 RepID=A0A6A5G2A2_CAERE|nr:hypothetical protein GCK72_025211 [Caenorhabditis remanei]KAF1748744.1 hypothetical protein GCK72_025211 [Caenorhabditis remanei]